MGSASSHQLDQTLISTQISILMTKKISLYKIVKPRLLSTVQSLDKYPDLRPFKKSLEKCLVIRSTSIAISFNELQSFLLANLGQNLCQDKESLRVKRSELFDFTKVNLIDNEDFAIGKCLKILNRAAENMLGIATMGKINVIHELMSMAVKLVNALLGWFYGDQIFRPFINPKRDEQTNDSIISLYKNELAEFLLFHESSKEKPNRLLQLRQRQVHLLGIKLKDKLTPTISTLKKSSSKKEELAREQKLSYDIVITLIQRMAKAPMFTSKYKLLSIVFDTIPHIYLHEQKKKNFKSFQKTISHTPEKNRSVTPDSSHRHRNQEVQSILSSMLSAEKKKEISKLMLKQWMMSTKRDILTDILIPFNLLQESGYIQEDDEYFLLAFQSALYEVLQMEEKIEENAQ